MNTVYYVEGNGFSVRIDVSDNSVVSVGSIVQGIMDASLGAGDAITVRRPVA